MKRRPQGPKAVSKAARAEGGQAQSSIGQISEKRAGNAATWKRQPSPPSSVVPRRFTPMLEKLARWPTRI